MSAELQKKEADIEAIAGKALKDDKLRGEILENLWSKNETIRYNSYKVLLFLAQEHPETLYPKWDYFVRFLGSENTYHKLSAIKILANLTRADNKRKFEKIFEQFYSLLEDRSYITAAYLAGASGIIAKAKPKLELRITNKLLGIDKTHHEPERRDLVKAYAIEAIAEYFDNARNKSRILDFVEEQLKSKSPKTRKVARDFLQRVGR
jgi:hypothetical protein